MFVNTEVTEAEKKLNLEELGINTDINKAQVITKDEVVEQIDTQLHTDMLNKTVRDDFMEDLLKTGLLVPEVVQGIKEGLTNEGETVLGQISNNMGERSDEIKAFVEGRDKKLEKELEKHKNEKGELVYNEETKNLITENILTTLDEFGKGKYEVIYVKGDANDPSMSINDEDGRVYVNINGSDFGDAESMRKTAQHEGGHGTYKDKNIDEKSAGKLGNNKGTTTKPNIVVDSNMNKELEAGQLAYKKDKEDDKLRDRYYGIGSLKKDKFSNMSPDQIINEVEIRYGIDSKKFIKELTDVMESEGKSTLEDFVKSYGKDTAILLLEKALVKKGLGYLAPGVGYIILGADIVNDISKPLRGWGSKDRAALVIALGIEQKRLEKAIQYKNYESKLVDNIFKMGTASHQQYMTFKDMLPTDFVSKKQFNELPSGIQTNMKNILNEGLRKYNSSVKKESQLTLNQVIQYYNRAAQFNKEDGNADLYLKDYKFIRK